MTLFDRPITPDNYSVIRFGLGYPARGAPRTAPAMLERLLGPDHIVQDYPLFSFEKSLELGRAYSKAHKESRMTGDGAARKKVRSQIKMAFAQTVIDDFTRSVETDDPFRERLQQFWMNHFTTRSKTLHLRTGHAGYAAEAIRPHLTGPFAEMLKSAVTHPFMLLYLDQTTSIGPNSIVGQRRGRGLNENLAREVLELHTLGVGAGYTQADVTEFAKLLTGLSFSPNDGFRFRAARAEPGPETVLGQVYGGNGKASLADIHAALDDLARHPSTAQFICTKLAAYFVADVPDADLVASMIAAYERSGGYLAEVYGAMLDHPAAWDNFGAKVKWPVEFIITGMRALGVRAADLQAMKPRAVRRRILMPLRRMGQDYRAPPGPDGWPDTAAAWVDSQGLAARIGWAMAAARWAPGGPPDPRSFVALALGGAASEGLIWAARAAESRAEGVGIILASAEFNRR